MSTHQEKLEFIRKKCIEANDEIVELKFGCEVLIFGAKRRKVAEVFHEGIINVERYKITQFSPDEYKVVGRPIRLADVLLAVSQTGYANSLMSAMVHKDGTFGLTGFIWNLRKDSLEDQSEETTDSIYKLLDSKNYEH